ncbi:hypothetical protein C8J57DRAFT_1230899 [Mycena rebaudengoi]|nr:hypothetical protein C8J57DRAFT_1230899 [Mycena rebaudengoi]
MPHSIQKVVSANTTTYSSRRNSLVALADLAKWLRGHATRLEKLHRAERRGRGCIRWNGRDTVDVRHIKLRYGTLMHGRAALALTARNVGTGNVKGFDGTAHSSIGAASTVHILRALCGGDLLIIML